MYVIEFPFTKIVRVYSTAYYRFKKSTTDTFLELQVFYMSLKILENVQEKLCYGVPLGKLQVFRLSTLPSMLV